MNKHIKLIERNSKLFFKDKGMFFCSLITPLILLFLYITFLGDSFRESYKMVVPQGIDVSDKIIYGLAGGQLLSSLLSVSGVTVAFCANLLMVQDKISGARKDLLMTCLKRSTLSISYYLATLFVTIIISLVATIIAWIYLASVGWFLSFCDCLLILLDILLVSMFGTALSSLVNYFLTTQGQVSAVGMIISSMYGFVCGAYMPISSFSSGLQKILLFLPSTYISSLLRNHCMRGAFEALEDSGVPSQIVTEVKNSIDYNMSFFDKSVSVGVMFTIIIATITVLLTAYILINKFSKKKI